MSLGAAVMNLLRAVRDGSAARPVGSGPDAPPADGTGARAFRRLLARAVAVPLLVMVVLAGILTWQVAQLLSLTSWVDHTDRVIAQAHHAEKLLVDMETGYRGYLITGNAEFLEPSDRGARSLESAFARLGALVADNPVQLRRIAATRADASSWKGFTSLVLMIKADGGDYASVVGRGRGKQLMDRMRHELASVIRTEEALRDRRSESVKARTRTVAGLGLALLLVAGAVVGFLARRQLVRLSDSYGRALAAERDQREALRRSEERFRLMIDAVQDYAMIMLDPAGRVVSWNAGAQRLKGYRAEEIVGRHFGWFFCEEDIRAGKPDLELEVAAAQGRVEDEGWRVRKDGSRFWADVVVTAVRDDAGELRGFSKVTRDVTERKRAEDEIRRVNEELELRVEERTAELKTANEELEAFSYSVSHDLRAPLRTIKGFTQGLMEDYADRLDAEGHDSMLRVCSATDRMAQLIDDLLNLSRVTRAQLRREPVDLSAVARSLAADLRNAEPERKVEIVVDEGLVATGDPRLLRVVLENLLGNAWKFTGRKPQARIEFGALRGGNGGAAGGFAYFVRDDGAGFDMAYAGKLFGPFQRLHGTAEFPGTGIGLATVQRIVHRHGGRVWAEGAVGRGATVCFTLAEAAGAPEPGTCARPDRGLRRAPEVAVGTAAVARDG